MLDPAARSPADRPTQARLETSQVAIRMMDIQAQMVTKKKGLGGT